MHYAKNLPIMLFGISHLLCLFLYFLDMDYADMTFHTFNCVANFAENNHDRNEIDLACICCSLLTKIACT